MRGRCRETETRGAEGAEEGGGEHFSPAFLLGMGRRCLFYEEGGPGMPAAEARTNSPRGSVSNDSLSTGLQQTALASPSPPILI